MMTALLFSTGHLHAASAVYSSHSVGMPNPAAVYCNVMGGDMLIYDTPAGEVGLCVFPDMTVCEAWDFVGGTCGEQHSICAYYGLDEITLRGGRFSKYSNYCVGDAGIMGDVLAMIDFDEDKPCAAMAERVFQMSTPPIKNKDDFPNIEVEPVFSWRNFRGKNWVTPVKAQKQCGSCWAFATTATIEAHYNIFSDAYGPNTPNGAVPDFSEEFLVSDCSINNWGDCCGGWPPRAFTDLMTQGGIPDESCLPYLFDSYETPQSACVCQTAEDGTSYCLEDCPGYMETGVCAHSVCDQDFDNDCYGQPEKWHPISRYYQIENDIETIKLALRTRGPLSVSYTTYGDTSITNGKYFICSEITPNIEANPIHTYCWDKKTDDRPLNGICDDDEKNNPEKTICSVDYCDTTHAVLLTGYTEDAWEIKNSWGVDWANQGYFYIGFNECRIQDFVFAVEVDGFDYDALLEEEIDYRGIGVLEWISIGDRASVTTEATILGGYISLGHDSICTADMTTQTIITLRDRAIVDGNVIAGHDIVLGHQAQIWGTTTIGILDVYEPPVIPEFHTGATSAFANYDATISLVPGEYNVLELKDRSHVILQAGTYTFNEIRLGHDTTISTQTDDAEIDIFVRQPIYTGDRVKFAHAQSPRIAIYSTAQQIILGHDNTVKAHIIAPQAEVTLRDRVHFAGGIRARQLNIGHNVVVTD